MRNIIFGCIWTFLIPCAISSYNLKISYKINSITKELKEFEAKNLYLKKLLFDKTSLPEIQKKAFMIGLSSPDPSTVVLIENKPHLYATKNDIIIKIAKIFKASHKDT